MVYAGAKAVTFTRQYMMRVVNKWDGSEAVESHEEEKKVGVLHSREPEVGQGPWRGGGRPSRLAHTVQNTEYMVLATQEPNNIIT